MSSALQGCDVTHQKVRFQRTLRPRLIYRDSVRAQCLSQPLALLLPLSLPPPVMGPPSQYALIEQQNMHQNDEIPAPHPEGDQRDTSRLSNTEWAKHHVQQLATADSEAEYDLRVERALARHTNISLNGSHVSKENYRSQWGAVLGAVGAVRIHSAMETPQLSIHMCKVRTRLRNTGRLFRVS